MPNIKFPVFLYWLIMLSISEASGQDSGLNRHQIALDFTSENAVGFDDFEAARAEAIAIQLFVISPDTELPVNNLTKTSLILSSGIAYPTSNRLQRDLETYIDQLSDAYSEADRQYPGRIAAFELFRYPNDMHREFFDISNRYIDTLRTFTTAPLFYTTAKPSDGLTGGEFSYIASRFTAGGMTQYTFSPFTFFTPSESLRETLIDLQTLFRANSEFESSIIAVPAGWLFDAVNQVPGLEIVIQEYQKGLPVTIPLPAEPDEVPAINWSVLLLVLIWISFILHLRFQPVYGQSFSRYFLHHPFYLIDIIEHRVRNAMPGVFVLFQHAVLTALLVYVSASILISDTGLNSLSVHFPYLFPFQNELLSLSFAGFFTAALLETISVFWIYLLNKKLIYLSQVLNLYSWPIHINLITVTLLVVLSQSGFSGIWPAVLSTVFAFTWFMSFNMAAIDAARFLDTGRVLYLLLTAGVHVFLVIAAIWWILTTPMVFEPLQMAFTFS